MEIEAQAKAIRDALDGWAGQDGGKAFVAFDMRHLWEMWQLNVKSPRIIICYNGEDIRGEFGVAAPLGRVDRHWIALVTRGRDMTVDRGEHLIESGVAIPFLQLVRQARDLIRSLQLDPYTTERPVDFRSVRPYQADPLFADAYQIEFSVGTQLPMIGATPSTSGRDSILAAGVGVAPQDPS